MEDTPRSHPLRVLIVDDCKDNRDSLAMLLRVWGHEVRVARDGPSALVESQSFRPLVVILDIGLPGMSGWEVVRRLREQPDSHSVRVIALTGYGQEQDKGKAREAGFDAHLTKPADLALLRQLLDTAGAAGAA
jgi:two-component system CheB/CheR fusion protein